MPATPYHCDIFCAVVDNFGDAAVCWRLARQLSAEHGWHVRLWIDDVAPLARLAPDYAKDRVAVRPWPATWPVVGEAGVPDVVIEAFACDPPGAYVAAMAARPRAPAWINLEYLSAEPWVGGCHGLASPHPSLPLTKHFFFPGFREDTGGLLRECDYDEHRARFDAAAFHAEFGIPAPAPDEIRVSLFCYPAAPLDALCQAWSTSPVPIRLLWPGRSGPPDEHGSLRIHPLPFLPQARYDQLLWSCDLNFVRGEDSFVRAQWAAKPFVWHIYPQDDDAHRIKLDAFLDLHPAGGAAHSFWHAWNGRGDLDWPAFAATLPAQRDAAGEWERRLAGREDLATKLVQFCRERVK